MPTVKFTVRPRSTGCRRGPTGCPRGPTGCPRGPTGCPKGPMGFFTEHDGCSKVPTGSPRRTDRCPMGPRTCRRGPTVDPRRPTGCPGGHTRGMRGSGTGCPRGWFGRPAQRNGDHSSRFSGHPIEFLLAHLLSGGEEPEMRECPKTCEKSPCDKKPGCCKKEETANEQSKKTSDEPEKATDEAASNGANIQSMDELLQHFFSVMLGEQEDTCCNPSGKDAKDQKPEEGSTGDQETNENDEGITKGKKDEDTSVKDATEDTMKSAEIMLMTPMGPLVIAGGTEIEESDPEESGESEFEYVCHLEDHPGPAKNSEEHADVMKDVSSTEDQTSDQFVLREDEGFHVNFNLNGFEPEDINVKLAEDKLEINAHREGMEDGIKTQKDFFRIITLPTNVDADTVKCEFKDDGQMTLSAENKVAPTEKILTIQRVRDNIDMLE